MDATSKALPEAAVMDSIRHRHDSPGRLSANASIVIQTIPAIRVLHGRAGNRAEGIHGIMGLFSFAERTAQIFAAARADDPWADLYLLRIEEAVQAAQSLFKTQKARANERFEAWQHSALDSGVQCEGPVTSDGIRIELNFATPFAYMAAMLIGDLDHIVRIHHTGQKFGFVTPTDAHRITERLSHALRSTLTVVASWKMTSVCREDVLQMNQRAQTAKHAMGDLEPEVLEATRRSLFAPRRIVQPRLASVTPLNRARPDTSEE